MEAAPVTFIAQLMGRHRAGHCCRRPCHEARGRSPAVRETTCSVHNRQQRAQAAPWWRDPARRAHCITNEVRTLESTQKVSEIWHLVALSSTASGRTGAARHAVSKAKGKCAKTTEQHLGGAVQHGKRGVLAAASRRGARVPQPKLQPHIRVVPPHRRQRLRSATIFRIVFASHRVAAWWLTGGMPPEQDG